MKDTLRIKKLRNRIIILCLIGMIFAAGYYFLYSSLNSMKTKTAEANSDVVVLQGEIDNAVSLKNQYDEQSAERSKIESFIVKKGDEADFITVIESLAAETGLQYQIESVDLAENASSAENLQDLNLKISVTGRWQDAYQFLQLVENIPYSSTIKNVTLMANGQTNVSTSTAKSLGGGKLWQGSFEVGAVSFK